MTTSPYFNHTEQQGEIDLYDSITIESIQMTGFDILYIKRSDFVIDPVLFEAHKNEFKESFTIEANIPDNLINWAGEGTIMNQFGIQISNTGSILFSKTRWAQIQDERVQQGFERIERPFEGDLIYFGYGYTKFNNTIFVINQVDFSDSSWQMGRNFVYRCQCSLYSPTHNDIVDIPEFAINQQVADALKGDDIVRQNDNIAIITDSFKEFSEQNPFGGF